MLTIKITNSATTPARDVRAVVVSISDNPIITADQKRETQDGPFGSKIVRIDRIPPGETAIIDIVEKASEYPRFFGKTVGAWNPKYQYFPMIQEIQTEFGQVRYNYGRYARFCLRLPDDGGSMSDGSGKPDNDFGPEITNENEKRIKADLQRAGQTSMRCKSQYLI